LKNSFLFFIFRLVERRFAAEFSFPAVVKVLLGIAMRLVVKDVAFT